MTVPREFMEKACRLGVELDVGCGSGGFIEELTRSCTSVYVIGVDNSLESLHDARRRFTRLLVDLVQADASHLPLRGNSIGAISMSLLLHEVDSRLIRLVASEASRTLKPSGLLLVVDRVLFKPSKPSEEVVLEAEEAYHKALEYALNIRAWGLRKPIDYVRLFEDYGLAAQSLEVAYTSYTPPERFSRVYGSKTLSLASMIRDARVRSLIEELVKRVRSKGGVYGCGPGRVLVLLLVKRRGYDEGRA